MPGSFIDQRWGKVRKQSTKAINLPNISQNGKPQAGECVSAFLLTIYKQTSLITQLVKNLPAKQMTPVQFLGWEDLLENGQATHSCILGLPFWLSWQIIHLQCGRPAFDPWVGKIPGEEKVYPLQYSGLENSMDYIVHEVTKSWTQLSNFHSLTHHLQVDRVLNKGTLVQQSGKGAGFSEAGHYV